MLDRAAATGDAHAIEFVDTAADTHARTGDRSLPAGVAHSVGLIGG